MEKALVRISLILIVQCLFERSDKTDNYEISSKVIINVIIAARNNLNLALLGNIR